MIVVDTNVVVSYLIPGAQTAAAERARALDDNWVAPRLLASELLNALVKYVVVARSIERDRALRLYRRGMRLATTEPSGPDPLEVMNICLRSSLTSYDAEFVALVVQRNLRLITIDKGVLTAFPDVAVSLGDFAAGR
jgi:predicted nucleic acid-binding protein